MCWPDILRIFFAKCTRFFCTKKKDKHWPVCAIVQFCDNQYSGEKVKLWPRSFFGGFSEISCSSNVSEWIEIIGHLFWMKYTLCTSSECGSWVLWCKQTCELWTQRVYLVADHTTPGTHVGGRIGKRALLSLWCHVLARPFGETFIIIDVLIQK